MSDYMIVAKFGGTSVSTAERLNTIYHIIRRQRAKRPVVVVSAIRGVTDLLLTSVQVSAGRRERIVKELEQIHLALMRDLWEDQIPPHCLQYLSSILTELRGHYSDKGANSSYSDIIVSYGETLSSFIISAFFVSKGLRSKQVLSKNLIVTDENYGNAEFLPRETADKTRRVLIPMIERGIVPVVTGFIGSTKKGNITTLGRGGSDYSAAILGHALRAKEIQIWTDVDGIYSSDPRHVKDVKVIPSISYKEASELAAFGAKVLHPRTIRPAVSLNIPVKILNTLNPEAPGTVIIKNAVRAHHLVAITARKAITLVNLYSTDMLFSKGFIARIFTVFAKYNISVDLVSVSEVSVSVSFDNDENVDSALRELKKFTAVTVAQNYGTVTLIGHGISGMRKILRNIFTMLEMYNIEVKMISQGASDINISLVVPSSKVSTACEILHQTLIVNNKADK